MSVEISRAAYDLAVKACSQNGYLHGPDIEPGTRHGICHEDGEVTQFGRDVGGRRVCPVRIDGEEVW